jgi:pimeloyl-ACP methyl ester carboxylesterase
MRHTEDHRETGDGLNRETRIMAPIRRDILAMGAAATAMAAAPRVFAQQTATPGFYEKGNVRIRFQETGSGFPLLCVPGGGLNSRMGGWPTAVINAMDVFKNDFRCITMDQRNATGGESTGPIPVDNPWDAFADDQLGLMDHLGIRQFLFFGNCIGGSFALKLMERAPDRVAAAVLSQPIGHRPENPDVMYVSGRDVWAPEFRKRQPNVSMETIEKYLHNLYRVRADFVYSVSRDFVRTCQTPMLVLPDDTDAHAYQTSVDIASLAPNAEVTVYPWNKPPELKARTINRARNFLRAHQPMTAAR